MDWLPQSVLEASLEFASGHAPSTQLCGVEVESAERHDRLVYPPATIEVSSVTINGVGNFLRTEYGVVLTQKAQ
jgi:hypothetical protein